MKNSSMFSIGFLAVIVVIAVNCLYVVKQTERAVLLTFGQVTNFDIPPGLHFKIPGVHAVRLFDGRVQTFAANTESYLTVDRQYLEVDSFAKWRISNVANYYTSTSGNADIANNLLAQRVNTGLRNQFARRSMREVVSGERDLLMTELRDQINIIAQEELGIEVVDVRVKKIELPTQVSESVYLRMNTERFEEARRLRSTGNELAEGIRADADRQEIILEAEAYRDAERIRGEGDAIATSIYAEAFNKDAEFYEFVRSLNAYRETFNSKGDIFLLSPKSDFFKYLNSSATQ
jgi:modulator of FtsH protease HflC